GDDRADIVAPGRERRDFGGGIEILTLQTDGHGQYSRRSAPSATHPPVMGGKNAISLAPAIAASGRTWLRSMAARITSGFSNARPYSSPRRVSHATRPPTVAIPAGGSISSSGLPMRSRTQAK